MKEDLMKFFAALYFYSLGLEAITGKFVAMQPALLPRTAWCITTQINVI